MRTELEAPVSIACPGCNRRMQKTQDSGKFGVAVYECAPCRRQASRTRGQGFDGRLVIATLALLHKRDWPSFLPPALRATTQDRRRREETLH